MTALAELSAADFRELASLADLRELRRRNNVGALYAGLALGAFEDGAQPLPPLDREQLASAMSALALRGFSTEGLLRSAEGYSAGRLPSEVVDDVVVDVLRRRKWGQL
jgi:hypothetical protein